jgi:hypothetical protein
MKLIFLLFLSGCTAHEMSICGETCRRQGQVMKAYNSDPREYNSKNVTCECVKADK